MLKEVLLKVGGFVVLLAGFWAVLGAFLMLLVVITLMISVVIKSIRGTSRCRMLCGVFPIRKCQEKAGQKRANICGRDLFTNIEWVVSAGTGRGFVITCHPGSVKETLKS
jgi:hypothetical protein